MTNAEPRNKAILYAAIASDGLFPATAVVPKGLLPVYDKPLIYYPLSVLILAGIREIALISFPNDQAAYQRLLGNGTQFGVQIDYLPHDCSKTPARSFISAREFIGGSNVAFIFSDSLICGNGLLHLLAQSLRTNKGATAFARPRAWRQQQRKSADCDLHFPSSVANPSESSRSSLSGLYFYSNEVLEIAETLQSATNNRLRIDDINRAYFSKKRLRITPLGRGFALFDIDTHTSLARAANFISTIESTHGLKIGCVEEAAYRMGFLTSRQVLHTAAQTSNAYGMYLHDLIDSGRRHDDRGRAS